MSEIEERLRHDGNRSKVIGFVDDLKELWAKAGKKGEIVRNAPLSKELAFPRITYRVLKRVKNTDFKDIKPRHRTTIDHPYEPDAKVDLFGQIFSVYVEFAVYSTNQTEADMLLDELEDFIELYKGNFMTRGVQQVTFIEQGEDKMLETGRLQIAVRELVYEFRLEKIVPKSIGDIKQIDLVGTSVRYI